MDRPPETPWRPPVGLARRTTVAQFLRQCLGEFRKIAWPNGRTVRRNATVMLLVVIILVVGLGALELAVARVASAMLR